MKKFLRFFVFGAACYAVCSLPSAVADDVAPLDDFEAIPLKPFDVANDSEAVGDGTDYLREIPGWTRDDSGMPYSSDSLPGDHSGELAYEGGAAMDLDSWLSQQGNQGYRATGDGSLVGDNNTGLCFDPDAWDDFNGAANSGYNSYLISPAVDVSAQAGGSVAVELDYQFYSYANQRGTVEVSFDTDPTWVLLLDLDSSVLSNSTEIWGKDESLPVSVPPGASTLQVRVGCLTAGNDWSFVVDNIEVKDGGNVLWIEDFEGLDLLPFGTEEGQANPPVDPPGDGTDWTEEIVNWIIDNTGMLTVSEEGAFQGWRLLDGRSWSNQQGGQQRSFLIDPQSGLPERNSILVADPDAQDDFDVDVDDDLKEFNSYISRTYDVSGFNNGSIKVSFDWETRIESEQRALAEVSFDGGSTWIQIFNIDSDDPTSYEQYNNADFALAENDHFASLLGPTEFQFGGLGSEFAASQSNTMILRFGLIDAENNWWFAVDNILVEADAISFAKGDANGSGSLTNADISAFLLALTDPSGYASTYPDVDPNIVLDFNLDGTFSNADIGGFLNVLSGN